MVAAASGVQDDLCMGRLFPPAIYMHESQILHTSLLLNHTHPCICISYNTGKSALPDIYARRLKARNITLLALSKSAQT